MPVWQTAGSDDRYWSIGNLRNPDTWLNWGVDGSVDDVRVYDRTITSNEVTALYNGGTGTEDEGEILPSSGSLTTETLHFTTEAEEAYCSAQIEFTDPNDVTNVTILVSGDYQAPYSWTVVPIESTTLLGSSVYLLNGTTNFSASVTNLTMGVAITNLVNACTVHGIAYGRK